MLLPLVLTLCAPLLAHAPEGGLEPPPLVAIAELPQRRAELHDRDLTLTGRVAWAGCGGGTCLLELVSSDGVGPSVVARLHGELAVAPSDLVGRSVEVEGHFYAKVYPRYRLEAWQALGWRAGEALPEQAELLMLTGRELLFSGESAVPVAALPPLDPWEGPSFDLGVTEFEQAGTGTGRKCLAPGAHTPQHGTGSKQELLFGLEGTLTVEREGLEPFSLLPGQGTLVPPNTPHGLRNGGAEPACYLFVYSQPGG
jgi:quercetin dioxygenase-like cupin family protein